MGSEMCIRDSFRAVWLPNYYFIANGTCRWYRPSGVLCASKFAVEGFTKAMAIEWGSAGIRVNTICPTFIRTPLTEQTFNQPERVAWIKEKIKLGRTGEVEDIMGSVLYLASDASALVTGTALVVDGGWTAD